MRGPQRAGAGRLAQARCAVGAVRRSTRVPACRAGVLVRLPGCPRAMECLRCLPGLLPRAARSRRALCMAAARLSLAACSGRAPPLFSRNPKAPSTPRAAGTRVPRGSAASAPPALGPGVLTVLGLAGLTLPLVLRPALRGLDCGFLFIETGSPCVTQASRQLTVVLSHPE